MNSSNTSKEKRKTNPWIGPDSDTAIIQTHHSIWREVVESFKIGICLKRTHYYIHMQDCIPNQANEDDNIS